MNRSLPFFFAGAVALLAVACPDHLDPEVRENPASFKNVASVDLGGVAAAEISAYDPMSKRLFTVSNESAATIAVVDFSAFPTLTKLPSLNLAALGGVANSVAVSNGKLIVALEASDKQANGSVLVYEASTLVLLKQLMVGALPDMVTVSPDGKYIVTANEGEPNASYSNDPPGTISIIDVAANYSVKTLHFLTFEGQRDQLGAGGFRVFGPNADLSRDVEPEYVAISSDSKKAWVTLQENNGIAEVDLVGGQILRIWPLGTKDYSLPNNAMDPTNTGNTIVLGTWPVKSYFLPDAIAYFRAGNKGYLITADEGDAREYTAYVEQERVANLPLDPTAFPTAATLKQNANLGRLNVTKTAGDTDKDGDFDALFSFGGRGFSIYDAVTGQRVFGMGKSLEEEVIKAGKYDDGRSDDKGVEPEGVTTAIIDGKTIAFVGLERADAVAVYDVSNPTAPVFLQLISTGDAPEGLLYVAPKDSPNGRSMLVVSSEEDGVVNVYQPDKL